MSQWDDLLHTIWMHTSWFELTKRMTTQEREKYANAIERHSRMLHPDEPLVLDRWWR